MERPINLIEGWFKKLPGKLLLEAEQAGLNHTLSRLFGYHLLQVGILTHDDLLQASPIAHRVCVAQKATYMTFASCVQAAYDKLPFRQRSIDVVLLPHLLEFTQQPEAVLKEVDRVLIPEGHVIIFGFNPFSLWGLWWWLKQPSRQMPWRAHFLSSYKLRKWFSKLGWEITDHESFFFRFPMTDKRLLNRSRFLEGIGQLCLPYSGAAYMMVVKKRISTLTTVKKRRRRRRIRVRHRYAQPTARTGPCNRGAIQND